MTAWEKPDIAGTRGAYSVTRVPEPDAIKLSRLTPWEERENGAYGLYMTFRGAAWLLRKDGHIKVLL